MNTASNTASPSSEETSSSSNTQAQESTKTSPKVTTKPIQAKPKAAKAPSDKKSPSPKLKSETSSRPKSAPAITPFNLLKSESSTSSTNSQTDKAKKTEQIHEILRRLIATQQGPSTSAASISQVLSQEAPPKKIEKTKAPPKEFDITEFLTEDQLRLILKKGDDAPVDLPNKLIEQVGAIMPTKPQHITGAMEMLKSFTAPPLTKAQMTAGSDESDDEDFDMEDDDEEEEYIEFKYAPRQIYMATVCQHCKNIFKTPTLCPNCRLVYYCNQEHLAANLASHKNLCKELEKIVQTRGGHLYDFTQKLSFDEFRTLRVFTLQLCEQGLGRPLEPYEREIILFPRLCSDPICREWKPNLLTVCKECRHVSFCESKPNHLPDSHRKWCKFYILYYKLLLRQKVHGRIEPILPNKIVDKDFQMPANTEEVFKVLFKHSTALRDDCTYATMTQLATIPLTALHVYDKLGLPSEDVFTLHLVGSEFMFEGDTLDKYEAFMLHLLPPHITELRIVFVGSDLNNENLPLELISRIRPCRKCRRACRAVKFDFQCQMQYQDYARSFDFCRPDMICFFHPSFHYSKDSPYNTWPGAVKAALERKCPILVTSYTDLEAALDFNCVEEYAGSFGFVLDVLQRPTVNMFRSKKPERNFASEELAPMIFKNQSYFCVKSRSS